MGDFELPSSSDAFFDDVKERLTAIQEALSALQRGEAETQPLAAMRLSAHTIKRSAEAFAAEDAGVQDMGELARMLGDAAGIAGSGTGAESAAIPFLFELHDAMAARLSGADGEQAIPLSQWAERFEAMRSGNSVKPAASTKSKPERQAGSRPKRRRPKKPMVNANLIAAVMGTIEDSLEQEQPAADSKAGDDTAADNKQTDAEVVDTAAADSTETIGEPDSGVQPALKPEAEPDAEPDAEEIIDFRPALEALPEVQPQSTPENLIRVDRTRLSDLANQMIELGAERKRDGGLLNACDQMLLNLDKLQKDMAALAIDTTTPQQSRLQREMAQQLRNAKRFRESLVLHQKQHGKMIDGVREQVFGLTQTPLADIFSQLPQTLRDVAGSTGKKVRLLLSGESVEMDQLSAQQLLSPLTHLLTNAVAHGIEVPAARQGLGKEKEGQISLIASRSGRDIRIEVLDDGQGIDIEAISRKALEAGMIGEDELAGMNSAELAELIFYPGFSTAAELDDIAGRGIGMNVVADAIRELAGKVRVNTCAGEGTRIVLTLPATAAEQRARPFTVGGQRYGMLADLIHRVDRLDSYEVERGEGPYRRGYIRYAGQRVPLIDLRLMNGADDAGAVGDERLLLIIEHLEGYLGILADTVSEERDVILRDLAPYLKRYQPVGLMGNAIDADGSVLLLLDPFGIKQMWHTSPVLEQVAGAIGARRYEHSVLLVDDSNMALSVEKELFTALGFQVDVAVCAADALEKVGRTDYDLLVTDLEMPGIDGLELMMRLREESRFSQLPILAITARENDTEADDVIAAGGNACLNKRQLGGDSNLLVETLDQLLDIDAEG